MRSRWAVVSLLIVAASLAWAGQSTDTTSNVSAPPAAVASGSAPQASPASDPYLGMSSISTQAPDGRKPCTYFNKDCKNAWDGQHCGPQLGHCLCSVYGGSYACVYGGPIP